MFDKFLIAGPAQRSAENNTVSVFFGQFSYFSSYVLSEVVSSAVSRLFFLLLRVVCIPLSCHELPPPSTRLKCPTDPALYTTSAQAAHKAAFLQQYLPANRKLYLIGHSLGAKLVSELLRNELIARHTQKCYLLMPTLERIADTPNGRFLTGILDCFMTMIIFFAWNFGLPFDFSSTNNNLLAIVVGNGCVDHIHCGTWKIFSLFPDACREFLIGCWFFLSRQHGVDQGCMEATCHLTRPRQLRSIFTLALNEMKFIKELDMQVGSGNTLLQQLSSQRIKKLLR
ncbi:hypothetical protein J6590_042288 [Homalodisca vitripennis]|nr:hypothetical protein J6590_042288 [Homalodisca vitripennis]